MAENSKIEWCHHTFNPWIGCTKVSPGCANCYAENLDSRWKHTAEGWGKGKPRKRTSVANWRKPLQWNKQAEKEGICYRVFCASLADWLDDEVPIEWLCDLLALIGQTPHLDWLLLSKRLENFHERIRRARGYMMAHIYAEKDPHLMDHCSMDDADKAHVLSLSVDQLNAKKKEWWDGYQVSCGWLQGDYEMKIIDGGMYRDDLPPPNVWLGTSVEDQTRADERIPLLEKIPVVKRFLSCEPLLGPVQLNGFGCFGVYGDPRPHIDWVIVGGESGPNARPIKKEWASSLRDQCQHVASFLFKQWGEHDEHGNRVGKSKAGRLLDGREWNEFPDSKDS